MKMMSEREQVLLAKENDLQQLKYNLVKEIEEKIAASLEAEKVKLIEEAKQKFQKQNANELHRKSVEIKELQEILKKNDEKLQKVQQSQAEFLKKQRELELTVEKRVLENVQVIREKARKEIEDNF